MPRQLLWLLLMTACLSKSVVPLNKKHYRPNFAIQSRPFAGALRHLCTNRLKGAPDPITTQAAFDRVYRHFVINGNPAAIQTNSLCNYRGVGVSGDYMRCAIGLLIPNVLYSPFMEGVPVIELVRSYPLLGKYFGRVPRRFLVALQAAHDESARASLAEGICFRERIQDVLFEIADTYNLYIPKS